MAVLSSEAQFLFEISGIKLGVAEFTAREKISSPFEVTLSLVSEDEIKFDDVIGKAALLTILGDDEDRYFHGIINKFIQTGSRGRFNLYQARMVPSLWLLSLEQDCRIFQNKNTPDIIKKILKEANISADRFVFRLQNTYKEREYCVQYRETDLNFISRLLEEEGIFYFFEHSNDKYLLVFGDSPVNYQPISGEPKVLFNPGHGLVAEEEAVIRIFLSRQIRSGKATYKDFNFEKPSLDLTADEQADDNKNLEIYDYPGEYSTKEVGKKLAQIRLQEAVMYKDKAAGESVCPRFIPGFTFTLTEHDHKDFNQEYLLVDVTHKGVQPQVLEEQSDMGAFSYKNQFFGIPSLVTFRPERVSPKPVVEGVQTAIVTGPDKEEIYTDKYGRIKVQFHWDREGERNEDSSCWIRVVSSFAGGNYGCIYTPRVGHEVVVDFLEGDPDRPIVTGSVYNARTMPPYTLPDKKTRSTIKTNSSTGGEGFNEITFEDAKGNEKIFIHGEKNLDMRIKNDRREWVGEDRHLFVKRDKLEEVDRDGHVIIKRDEMKEIGRDHNLKIKGKEAIEVIGSRSLKVQGDASEVFQGKHSHQVSNAYYVKGKHVLIEAMVGLTIKVGGSFISMTSNGIAISGSMVLINSGGAALSTKGLNVVPPVPPLAAAIAGRSAPGRDPDYDAPTHMDPDEEESDVLTQVKSDKLKPDKTAAKDQKKSWIEIELVDEDDNPIAGERYKITLPDGKTVATGTTDSKGFARHSGIDPGTCKITFPKLDKDAWEKA